NFADNVDHLRIVTGSGAGSDQPRRNVEVSNNIFADTAYYGSRKPTSLILEGVSDVRVYNNTFYNKQGSGKRILRLRNLSNTELLNNIFHNGEVEVQKSYVLDIHAEHNAWSNIAGKFDSSLKGHRDLNMNKPGLNESNWVPLSSSPVVDAGTPLGLNSDFYGSAIKGAGPDIGAVENGSQPNTGTTTDIPDVYQPEDLQADREQTESQTERTTSRSESSSKETPVSNTASNIGTGSFSISIRSPSEIFGVVSVDVDVSHPEQVKKVKLYANGDKIGGDITWPFRFNLDTSPYRGRLHLRAVVFKGEKEILKNTWVRVVDETSANDIYVDEPEVSGELASSDEVSSADESGEILVDIISPAKWVSGTVKIGVNVNHPDRVSRVKLYANGDKIGADLKWPFNFRLDTSPYRGRLHLRAVAFEGKKETLENTWIYVRK
ncbi:Ig-like domain-containing protein, partial [Pseudohalioglobus lutimaris]